MVVYAIDVPDEAHRKKQQHIFVNRSNDDKVLSKCLPFDRRDRACGRCFYLANAIARKDEKETEPA